MLNNLTERTEETKMLKNIEKMKEIFRQEEMRTFLDRIMKEYSAIGDHKIYGGKNCGSDAENEGSRYIAKELENIGLERVELVPVRTDRFQFNDGSIKIAGAENIPPISLYSNNSPGTPEEGITARLVDLGMGDRAAFEANDIKGRIVLIGSGMGELLTYQVLEAYNRGALAVIYYTVQQIVSEDDIRAFALVWSRIPTVSVSQKSAELLIEQLSKNPEMEITLYTDVDYRPDEGTTLEVLGEIKGKTDEKIIYTGHLDHYFRCLQDNISSVATLLGIAKAMTDTGYKPERTIQFIFSGSHELGNAEAFPPDFRGIDGILTKNAEEIDGKVYANINFEYTAMSQKVLKPISGYELSSAYGEFTGIMPQEAAGFDEVAKEVNPDLYMLGTWTDSAVFMRKGIPYIMNDAISEQMYQGESPYMGRDHSTADNWEAYSLEALATNTFWYGALGVFLDSQPLMKLDMSARAKAMALTEEEEQTFAVCGCDTAELKSALAELEEKGAALYSKLTAYNSDPERKELDTEAFNAKLLKAVKNVTDSTEFMASTTFGCFMTGHKLCSSKAGALMGAAEMFRNGQFSDACQQILPFVDLAGISFMFNPELAEEIKNKIESTTQNSWADGKYLSRYTLSDAAEATFAEMGKEAPDYSRAADMLESYAQKEMKFAEGVIKGEVAGIKGALKLIDELIEMI